MGAGEIIAIVAIALIVVGATAYIIKAKKSGRKCIGCPSSGSCHLKKCNCAKQQEDNECCCEKEEK